MSRTIEYKGKSFIKYFVDLLYFDLLIRPKMPFQGDAPEGGDTF